MSSDGAFKGRVAAALETADLAAIVAAAGVKLGRGKNPRGLCPFHDNKSASFTVYPESGVARCWGCGWSGDAIKFLRDRFNLNFIDALRRVEGCEGLEDVEGRSTSVRREKQGRPRREPQYIEAIDFGRWLWKHARLNEQAVTTYFLGRGVPEAFLADLPGGFFDNVRFIDLAPIAAWRRDKGPGSVPQAPALVSLVRSAPDGVNPPWKPSGVHVTFLSPDLTGKMVRFHNGQECAARKMLGRMAGGCVLFPGLTSYADELAPLAPLFVGEGLETVLSGMAIHGAHAGACGLAALSLDTLQGPERRIRGARPLFEPEPDWERGHGLAFRHSGPVTVLVDADMKPLRGPIDQESGLPKGEAVIEVRRGPIVHRPITGAERAAICAALAVKSWRHHGVEARAVRPRMGQDFNDAVREVPHG